MQESSPGIATFLFTDIEGSTRLWESYPEAMDQALRQHDDLLRSVFERRGGHVFKTVGDMFCVAFKQAIEGLEAAYEAQLWLHEKEFEPIGPLKVRMALYTGPARPRDDDYFGPALNRVSRLLGVGHGQQILVSDASREALHGAVPAGTDLLDLGPHLLRDLDKPERIFQLTSPSLRDEFPPLKTIDAIPNNLPRLFSSFIGREQETEEVKALLREKSLVSLVGAGGCGKTRLAIQVAQDVLAKFEGGVWFIDLAPISDPSLLPSVTLDALGLTAEPGLSPLDSLVKHVRNQPVLMVMDNCEHLVDAAAKLAMTILQAAPKAKILATTREALGIPGEVAWRVPSLPVPNATEADPEEALESSAAVKLFFERAVASQPSFELTETNLPSVISICRRLDGIPLALELAAARVKALPVDQIASRLDDRFRLLTGGSRTALPRQQTLRALIDWSHNLLDERERIFLARLAIFSGGFTLEACEGILDEDPIEGWESLDFLSQLVEKSLLVYEERNDGRYRLLETVRQYASEKLFDRPEMISLRMKHLAYYQQLAIKGEPEVSGERQAEWLDRLEADIDNFRSALEWALGSEDLHAEALRLAKALSRFWEIRGFHSEGRGYLERALDVGAEHDPDTAMRAYNQLGNIAREQGDYEATIEAYGKSLELAERANFKRGIGVLYNNLGITYLNLIDLEKAEDFFARSEAICREIDDKANLGAALSNYGDILIQRGRLDTAKSKIEESIKILAKLKDTRGHSIALFAMGEWERASGRPTEARRQLGASIEMALEIEFKMGLVGALEALGHVAQTENRSETAAKLYGFAARYRRLYGIVRPPHSEAEFLREEALAREALGDETYSQYHTQGARLKLDEAIQLGTSD